MISKVAVFHRGGAVLWRSDENEDNTATDTGTLTPTDTPNESVSASTYTAINKLINTILLSDKAGTDSMVHDSLTLKWTFANNLDLVFVAVYFSFQKLFNVNEFLQTIKNEFIQMFNESLNGSVTEMTQQNYSKFYEQFKRIQKYHKSQYKLHKKPKQWHETTQGQQQQMYKFDGTNTKAKEKDTPKKANKPRPFQPKKKNKNKSPKSKSKKSKKSKKKLNKQHWSADSAFGFNNKKVSKADMDSLNFALSDDNGNDESYQIDEMIGTVDLEDSDSSDSDDYSDLLIGNNAQTQQSNSIWSRFSKLIGNKALEESDVISVLQTLENKLCTKNVSQSIASELCQSLKESLIGKQIGTFETIHRIVRQRLCESLERILNVENINILHAIATAKAQKRPFVITFIGVNGVGKSTSLSKVIYYLKSRNLSVSVAACDTFRSGAVEQLKTHCKALKVRLFSQGYARDASSVASRAIREAGMKGDDVVLIDTAGRMQNNAPLMKSLVSLISKNKPDLTLFVGEALVGNDGIDQLTEFNKALRVGGSKKLIDGIILTKFDTVDDKVGAAISMTYKSRKPIIFIGTGQHYPDLKRMHVKTLINKLLQ